MQFSKRLLLTLILLHMAVAMALAQKGRTAELLDRFSHFRQFTMTQGLANNTVRSVAQDDDGFLWFGTEEGLSRFDGERFTTIYQQHGGGGLPNNYISQLIALPGHRLLVGTKKGLCLVHTRNLRVEQVNLPLRQEYATGDLGIWKLLLGRDGRIWVGTGTGIHLLDNELHIVGSYLSADASGKPVTDFFIRDLLELPDGTVALKGLVNNDWQPWQVVDFQKQSLEKLAVLRPALGMLDSTIYSNCVSVNGQAGIWHTTLKKEHRIGLYYFDWLSQTSTTVLRNAFPASQQDGYFFPTPLPDSLLLLDRYFGKLALLDLRQNQLIDLPAWSSSWPDGNGTVNFLDKDHHLWLCPRNKGIYFLDLRTLPATALTALNAEHQKAIDQNNVSDWFGFTCAEYLGKILISSSNGGLYAVDKNSGQVTPIYSYREDFKGMSYVRQFAPARGDTVWMFTLAGPFWLKTSTLKVDRLHPAGGDSLDNRFLYRDHFGLIWGRVRNNGVISFDTRNGHWQHYPSQGANAPFPITSATMVTETPAGDLWFSFGSEKEFLVKWTRQTGLFEKIKPVPTTDLEPGDYVSAFFMKVDSHGNLWLQTREGLLFVMDLRTYQVKPFGRANGLVTDFVNGFTPDTSGMMWLATPNGLSRYDPASHGLRTFYAADGLLNDNITNVELLDTTRNLLLVSTTAGLCIFDPAKIGPTPPAPPTYLTALWVSDSLTPLPENGLLALPYARNTLRFEFTGINFPDGSANRYQYRLDGADEDWRSAGTDNFANYVGLAPGKYTFRLRSANSDGVWSERETTLEIRIYPPFWATWTFRLAFIALLLVMIWFFYQRQIHSVRRRETEKNAVRQQLADLEMKALRAQMNPHFVFNALNSVQNFILKNDTREASRYLTKFARLMRLILENSESPMVPLAREIELLRYYTELEQLRFNNRFSFDFQVDSSLNPESISIPGMLIQPHIENAIWHGLMHKTTPGHLFIRFRKADEKTIVCEIEDDGVGRVRAAEIEKDRPKKHRSTGLANIQTRLELLNAQLAGDIRLDFEDLYAPNGEPLGTKIIVRMPITS